ncbi:ABC transporter permease [Clostridium sp. HBUAS56017]|uniref:ABC transporter permease n=1 Tax=Clostridium sp. HBUAS56017 TaxID=2571128 RepID=UPI001177900C|nr:ABC transporter permease [Clostridium sp. HBUAS56017]
MMKNNSLKSVLAVILGLIAGALLMVAMGHNPIEGYIYLTQGGLMTTERIANTIATSTPLILTGLSLAFAFRTGLFNIGAPGQMLFGGFCATAVALTFTNLPRPILLLFIVLSGLIGGALCAALVGLLKAKFNVHEVVGSIMLNWIIYWIVYYVIPAYFKADSIETESRQITDVASLKTPWLTQLFNGSFINYGILIAIIAVVLVWFILDKTVLGYQLKAVGFNKFSAEYAGISVNKNIIVSMGIAGALSGLAGVAQYVGNATCIQIGVMPDQGFDGIAVALLGGSSPFGVLIAALFFGLLYAGKGFMTTMASIPPEIADTIMATIIYFAATSMIMDKVIRKFKKRKKEVHIDVKEEK